MPKKAYKIEDFSGGINQLADPRDIQDNQFEELFNADVSRIGRITLPGNALEPYQTINVKNNVVSPDNTNELSIINTNQGLTPGYGLFAFSHDFNMRGFFGAENLEQSTDFLCINDGAHIDIWDSCHAPGGGIPLWINSAIKLGEAHLADNGLKVKPSYYMANDGIRVIDSNFGEQIVESSLNEDLDSTEVGIDVASAQLYVVGEYIKIDTEIIKIDSILSNTLTVSRGQFGTIASSHSNGADIYKINVPKIFTHIYRPMLEKAEGASPANTFINRWVEDIQSPEPPQLGALEVLVHTTPIGTENGILSTNTIHPSTPEKVIFGIQDSSTNTNNEYYMEAGTAVQSQSGNTIESIVIFSLKNGIDNSDVDVIAEGFAIGKSLTVYGAEGNGVIYNGVWEIVGFGDDINEVKVACEYASYTPPTSGPAVSVILEEQLISDDLKNKWIFGMSYLYSGGGSTMQESDVRIGSTYNSGSLTNNLYSAQFNNIADGTWKTAEYANIANTDTFNTSESDNWVQDADSNKARCDGNGWLLSEFGATNKITAGANYIVTIDVSSYTSGNFEVYIGKDGSSSGGTSKTINSAGVHRFTIQAQETDADLSNVIAIKSNNFNGDLNLVLVHESNVTEMSFNTSADLRGFTDAALSGLSFLCNNSRTTTAQNYSWNERIEGFRIYMKQVDIIGGGLGTDWLLLYDVNLAQGTYVCHGKDGTEEKLQLANPSSTGNDWNATSTTPDNSIVTTALAGDRIASLPLLTYESENGYPSGTNLAAMYKSSAIVQRKVYIGNLKINNKLFPDRMIRADADKFDSFPDDGAHFIDVATSDGDSIVKLESFGDKLIQFKSKTSYLIKVTSEGEELEETWSGAGVLSPSQVVKTNKGVVWANANGLYLYDGEKLSQVSEDRFKSDEWSINENEETPVILGYHENSNKVIIQTLNNTATDSGGFIYDLSTGAIIQCQKLFKWYISQGSDNAVDSATGSPKVSPPLIVTSGEGPLA